MAVIVMDGDILHEGHQHAGARLDDRAFLLRERVPFRVPDTFGHMAIGLGQPVDLRHVEAQGFDGGQCGGGGRGACGKDLHHMIEGAAVTLLRLDQHVQHDGRAAEMGDAVIGDGVIDVLRRHVAAADDGTADRRHAPGVAPAVAVEKRHDGQVDRVDAQLPRHRSPHRQQIGAAMVVDHALRPPRRAGGVVKREALPFILGQDPGRIGIALGQKVLIGGVAARCLEPRLCVRDLDDGRPVALHHRDGGFGKAQKRGIDQRDLRLAMAEDIAHRIDVEPCVDRVQHRPCRRDAETRLGLGRDVRQKGRHHIARFHPAPRQSRGKPADPRVIVAVAAPGTAVDHRRVAGKDRRRARKE